MFNSNKLFLCTIGVIFLIAGLGKSLEMLNISFSSVVLFMIGASFFYFYRKLNNKIFLYLSCFFIPIGIAYFVISVFRVSDAINFLLIYSSLACAFFCTYLISKRKLFLCITLAIIMFALHVFTNAHQNMSKAIIGYDCFYLGILMIFLFIFEHKSFGYIPLNLAIFSYIGGVLNFLNTFNIISPIVYKLLLSVVFIFIGSLLISYSFIKSKTDKKENLYEQTN